jgi:hypothetical protein
MKKEVRDAFRIHYKRTVLRYAEITRSVTQTCRTFEVPRSTFYEQSGKGFITLNVLTERLRAEHPMKH